MAFRELEERLDEEKPLRTFQVTLNIRVRSDNDFDPKLLSVYLQAAVQILIEQDRCGTGPVPENLAQLNQRFACGDWHPTASGTK